MRDALILAGLTIGGIFAFFPAETSPPPPAAATTAGASAALGRARRTELIRAGDGHFYAAVTIGARPITMLVDTGASVVALTGEDARAAGLVWHPGELTVVAQGAGGPVRGVATTLDRLQLGPHEARRVPAVIVPEGLPVSLLGQSFLREVDQVRIERDRMVLGR